MMKSQIIFISLLFPILLWSQENQTIRAFKAEKLYVKGLELYQSGNVRGAIQTFDEVIALDRNHGQVYQAKGDAYYELGDYDEAIESYTIAAQQYPDNANIRNSMGVSAAQLGMFRAAESYFLEALQIDPNLASARRNLERAQLKIREGSDVPDVGYAWEDDPVRQGGITGSVNSGWGEPWEGTYNDPPNNNSGSYDNGNYDYGENNNNSSGSWGSGFVEDPYGTNNTSPNPGTSTPGFSEPLKPWERNPRDPRKTSFWRDKGEIHVTYRTDPFVHIDQVRITPNSTMVTFIVESINREPFLISLEEPGSPGALMITDRQFQTEYRLKDIRLEGWPDEPYELRPGEKKPIIAEFERIPDNFFFFHIIEGESPTPGSWDFYDVELVTD